MPLTSPALVSGLAGGFPRTVLKVGSDGEAVD